MSNDEIPRTAEEAEETLEHALEHVSGLPLRRPKPWANKQACAILRAAIDRVLWQQRQDYFVAYGKERFGEDWTGIDHSQINRGLPSK